MENERNSSGHFVKGHSGFKPKGSLNATTRQYLDHIEKVIALLENNLEDNILNLSPKEQVMLWLDLQKLVNLKIQKDSLDTPPEKEQISKITFQVVGGGNYTPDEKPTQYIP